MNKDSEQPEVLIGAFVPVGVGLLSIASGVVYLVSGGVMRVIFGILTVLLIATASAILGAIWVSRRQ